MPNTFKAMTEIRPATIDDLPRIFQIYNREVSGGIATFDIEPRITGIDDGWLTERAPYHPVVVATEDGRVVGWASIGPWSPRGAYRRTGEVSVYVDEAARGRGLGKRLLDELIEFARAIPEISVLLARIAQPNPASRATHEAVGFRSFGTQRRAGEKFGRVLDVDLLDLHLE